MNELLDPIMKSPRPSIAALLATLGAFFCASVSMAEEDSTKPHMDALYEGKYATGAHAALHQEPASANQPAVGLAALWESKYVSEGRNNLDDGGIFSFEGIVEWKGIAAGAWFAAGDEEDYQEVNVFIEYCVSAGPLDVRAGYARLEFLEDHEHDNEYAAGVALNVIPFVVPALDYVYSTEAEGGFLELTLSSEVALFGERFMLEPYVLQAFDFGYATDGHDGANNFQVGIAGSLALMDGLNLVGSLSHSWAQKDVDRECLGDLSWGAIGLAAAF
ncbi:hypothetical protein [Pontiella sulfatireligans]|uniref:Copper resistance protein B n=1 Tax=Pontiella sulfatireligans TaxID=2750658 RepID=A0A6C2UPH0_9BACT|nr:hypothetical protein [Pontiella sulfatireligans]VGO22200.1 hypothetical protein SCARR_04282 [Pontiella sulfatireligans]